MKNKLDFEKRIIIGFVLLTFIPLIISYVIFLGDKTSTNRENIKLNLKNIAFGITQDERIQKKLYLRDNDGTIQEYTKNIINNIKDIDLIVIGDMSGEKYSHLDESQIGEIYINPDNKEVLDEGKSYYSLMEGSVGKTLRWFEPIKYKEQQVGFIMIGKYYNDLIYINKITRLRYLMLFIFTSIISIVCAKVFARRIKKSILGMEPEEIVALYKQKKIIIDSVCDGIISLNSKNEVIEINKSCYDLIDNFSEEKALLKLKEYIDRKDSFEMKELIIQGQKLFVTLKPFYENDNYLGMLITLSNKEQISKIAKEITGVDEIVKDLRANIHEFKNTLHVILGLIQLKEYEQAKRFILKVQNVHEENVHEFVNIKDYYVRALLLSRKLIAKERNIKFNLDKNSFLYDDHEIIDSQDLITILGNLIENAFEACTMDNKEEKNVRVFTYEDSKQIEIRVIDNGISIEESLKDNILKRGISSKGSDRGTGLYLVNNKVELYNGKIAIEECGDEKIFRIIILKGE